MRISRPLAFFLGLAAAFLSISTQAATHSPDPLSHGTSTPTPKTADEQLDYDWRKIGREGEDLGPRELIGFMLDATAVGTHAKELEEALTDLEKLQDRDATSATYGNFRWYRFQPKPIDLNAVEFTMQQAILIWKLDRDRFSPQQQERFANLINLSVTGIQHHRVVVTYTNIYLMKMWNLIAIGEAFHRQDVAEEGYAMLSTWMNEVATHGIHEYLSPTYTAVDLDSLRLINKYAARAEDRALAENALNLIYWECRANWLPENERLGGSHSRDYDYLLGHGILDQKVSQWGWDSLAKLPLLSTFINLTEWKPKNFTKYSGDFTITTPRFTWLRWGYQPEQVATHYIGAHVSMGVDGTSYGVEDKLFCIDFNGGPQMVMANFFMDGRGDPYGQNKVKGPDGHVKAHHLEPFFISAQDGPNVMFFSSYRTPQIEAGKPPAAPLTCLNSHLDLPAEVSVWQDNHELQVDSGKNETLDPSKPVFLRYKDVAVGMRFSASDCEGNAVLPIYYRDGDALNAARISWAHASAAPDGEAHVTAWVKVAEKLDAAGFVQFQKSFAQVAIGFQFTKGKLSAEFDTEPRLAIQADIFTHERKSSTKDMLGIFAVNGVELGGKILNVHSVQKPDDDAP